MAVSGAGTKKGECLKRGDRKVGLHCNEDQKEGNRCGLIPWSWPGDQLRGNNHLVRLSVYCNGNLPAQMSCCRGCENDYLPLPSSGPVEFSQSSSYSLNFYKRKKKVLSYLN